MKSNKLEEVNISRYPNAGTDWIEEEDVDLKDMILSGLTVARIASQLGRPRSEIRERIARLNLVSLLDHKDRARLLRCRKRDLKTGEASDQE